jgi:hypothetical protein
MLVSHARRPNCAVAGQPVKRRCPPSIRSALSLRRVVQIPRYLVVRTFEVDQEAMPGVARRSKEIAAEEFPEITWEHSHVIIDDDGTVRAVLRLRSAGPGDAQEP